MSRGFTSEMLGERERTHWSVMLVYSGTLRAHAFRMCMELTC